MNLDEERLSGSSIYTPTESGVVDTVLRPISEAPAIDGGVVNDDGRK